MTTLKPCPFCGGKANLTENTVCWGHGEYHKEFCVRCENCGAKGNTQVEYELTAEQCKTLAIEKWNTRTPKERGGEK